MTRLGSDIWVYLGLLLVLLLLPLPYGSNTAWAAALLGGAVSLLMLVWLALFTFGRAVLSRALNENWILIFTWLCLIGWIAFQLIPLPYAIIEVLSPTAAAHYNLVWAGIPTRQWPISIEPEKTYHRLLLSVSYFQLYILVLLTVVNRARLLGLAGLIAFSGMAQSLYGSLMVLSGEEYVFLSKKTAYIGKATGTFINRNHLAGYLVICCSVGIGLILADLQHRTTTSWRQVFRDYVQLVFSRKLRVRIFLAIMVIGLVLTQSRMGNVSFIVSLVLCGITYIFLRERKLLVKSLLLFSSLLLVDVLILSNWFGLDKVVERVEQTQIATELRADIAPELAGTISAYWLTGAGLGTFQTAFLPYRVSDPDLYYRHAHNDYAQFLIEIGVIGVFLLACLVLMTFVHALRVIASRRDRAKTGIAFAALMSITGMAIHSVTDFNLQIPATAATLVVVMAMANSCSHKPGPRQTRKREVRGGNAGDGNDPIGMSLGV